MNLKHTTLNKKELIESLNEELAEQVENRSTLRQKRESLTALYEENARKAPAWLTAQAALERYRSKVVKSLSIAKM